MESKEDFMNAFEKTQDKGDLKLSQEEADKFKTAFEDPEFCKLMSDYVADLQNPEYRAETEAYIGQLENDDKVPQGKELIRPEKGFVAKSHKRDQRDKVDTKVFINIVQSEKITKPSKTDTDKGQNWSLPYSLGPPHMEKDKKEEAVVAFDCCFHPDALSMGNRYKQFRDLLVSTAIQGIEEASRLQNQPTTVNTDFRVLKGVSYKTGEVPTMMVDTNAKDQKWKSATDSADKKQEKENETSKKEEIVTEPVVVKEQSAIDMVTALEEQSDIPKPTKSKPKPAVKKGFLNNAKTAGSLYPTGSGEGKRGVAPTAPLVEELPEGYVSKSKPPAAEVSSKDPKKEAKVTSEPFLTARAVTRKNKPTATTTTTSTTTKSSPSSTQTLSSEENDKIPKFTLIERGILGLGDFDGGNSSHKRKPVSSRPEELVYRIEIPLVTKTSKVELDVGEKELKMTYLDVYNLCIKLPYNVYEKKGGAKFDKIKKLLTITLPVQPFQLDEEEEEELSDATNDVEVLSESVNDEEKDTSSQTSPSKKANAHDRWLSSGSKEPPKTDKHIENEKEDITLPRVEEVDAQGDALSGGGQTETLAEEIARKAKEAVALAKTRKKEEKKIAVKTKQSSTTVSTEKTDSSAKGGSSAVMDFIPSGTYVGSKKGYVFKKGDTGMGYYIDNGGKPVKKAQVAAAPKPVDSLDAIDMTTSTIDCTKCDQENKTENIHAIQWQEFPYQFRQTKEGVAMIIDVKNIIEESVNINFQARSFDVSFAAASASESRVEVKTTDFALSFDCLKDLDIEACKFDAATDNMVVVLQKKVAEFWVSESDVGTKTKSKSNSKSAVVVSREYSGDVVNSSGSTVTSTSSSSGSSSSGMNGGSETKSAVKELSNTADVVVDAMALLNEMKFGSAGLLDLD